MNTAHDYCQTISEELSRIDEISQWWQEDVETTTDRLRESATGDANKNASLDALADWLESEYSANTEDIGAAYLNDALDVYSVLHHRWNQQLSVDRVVLLRTCNGPHCEIVWDGDDMLTVNVWWGGEESSRRVECSPVADALALIAEMAEQELRS